jgi:hypothetical protein
VLPAAMEGAGPRTTVALTNAMTSASPIRIELDVPRARGDWLIADLL